MKRFQFAVFVLLFFLVKSSAQQVPPFRYEPSLARRIAYSQIICSATIITTQKTGHTRQIGDADRNELFAEAEVHHVFKGTLFSRRVRFRYFDFGSLKLGSTLVPPTASFQKGSTYILFLKGDERSLEVAVPVFQMEIVVEPQPPSISDSLPQSPAGIAFLLFNSVHAQPKTIGRMATQYFSWAEEIIGRDAVPDVDPFLASDDELVRYQAAWWLSFRRINESEMAVLVNTKDNRDIEEWARSGAAQRLEDIKNGNWVPSN